MALNAHIIAKMYTKSEIEEKIKFYENALQSSAEGGYSLNTSQSNQSASPADITGVERLYALWLKALAIKTGKYTGAKIHAINYTP